MVCMSAQGYRRRERNSMDKVLIFSCLSVFICCYIVLISDQEAITNMLICQHKEA